jgi:hypothetical protein
VPATPELIALQSNYPQSYVTILGGTLRSIAQRFLKNSWQWREVWRQTLQIRSPNQIYPGDVLKCSHDAGGRAQLKVAEHEETLLIKLSPQVSIETLNPPIPLVPRGAVESFLTRAPVVSKDHWERLPYSVADDDVQVVYADRDQVYVRGGDFAQLRYHVFRPGEILIEPSSGRNLGTAGIYMGNVLLDKDDDPATFNLVNTIAPIRAGDRLFEIEAERELYSFEPHPVPPDTDSLSSRN